MLKEVKYVSKIFRPCHEDHFTILHFANSKTRVLLKRAAPASLLQRSFYVPNLSSECLGEPHTGLKTNRGFRVQAATCASVCSTVHKKGHPSLVYSTGQALLVLKFKALKYHQL